MSSTKFTHKNYEINFQKMSQKFHNVLSKLIILYWFSLVTILSCMQPVGHRLDMPARCGNITINKKDKVPYMHGAYIVLENNKSYRISNRDVT